MVWGDLIGALRRLWQAAALVGALCALCVAAGCGGVSAQSAGPADPACAEAVRDDWGEDGRVDASYDASCYLSAIDSLPQDVRAYTSAADDIFRALHAQRPDVDEGGDERTLAAARQPGALGRTLASERPGPSAPGASSPIRMPPAPVLLLGAVGLALSAAVALHLAARRTRRSS